MIEQIIGNKICYIGTGEVTVLEILKRTFPQAEFKQQVSLTSLFPKEELTDRQRKETIDILMIRKNGRTAIRVNGKEHQGWHKAQSDKVQKQFLIEHYIKVADINEYESKEVFKEKINYMSLFEVCNALFQAGVKP